MLVDDKHQRWGEGLLRRVVDLENVAESLREMYATNHGMFNVNPVRRWIGEVGAELELARADLAEFNNRPLREDAK